MAWAKPDHSRRTVDGAGRQLAETPVFLSFRLDEALSIINNWRASHSYPLLAMRMTLTGRARKIDERAIIAQRLKRLSSIKIKLGRNSRMALSQMQDIGGC